MTDLEMWDKIREGDPGTYRIVYDQYATKMYGYGMKFTRDCMLVENAIQTVFLNIFNSRGRISQTDNILAYLLSSLKRQLLSDMNKEIRQLQICSTEINLQEVSERDDFHLEIDPESIIVNSESLEERVSELNNALNKLSGRQREVIYLKYNQELSGEEIAKIMDINHQSVRNMLNRAINLLRKEMGANIDLIALTGVLTLEQILLFVK